MSRRTALAITLAGLSLWPASATAQNAAAVMANPAFRDPPPATCISTFDLQHCGAHDLRVADAAMSSTYFAARKRLAPAPRARLLTDQRRWLADRDARCRKRAAGYAGGTIAPVVFVQCLVAQTRARTAVLRGWR